MDYNYINNLIDNCIHRSGCWFHGFLMYVAKKPIRVIPRITANVNNAVVIFNDEIYETIEDIPFENFTNSLVLTGSPLRVKQLSEKNVNAIFWPWLHWFRYLIPIRRINSLPAINNNEEFIFNFLNRRWQDGRAHLIRYIVDQHPEIIKTGFITANNFAYYRDYPGFKKDTEFSNFFENFKGTRLEDPTDYSLLKEGCSVIVKNFYHIAEHIPGKICIQIETAGRREDYFCLISEKSMLLF